MARPGRALVAKSAAALSAYLLDPANRDYYTLQVSESEGAQPWATLDVAPDCIFPTYQDGTRGDTSKQGQAGVWLGATMPATRAHAVGVVVERARRMGRS